MINAFSQVNFLAVLAACVANFVFAGLWFVVVIAKQYTVALGRENLPAVKPTPLFIAGPALCNLIIILAMATLFRALNIQSLPDALGVGLLIGFGIIVPTCMTIAINPNFPRPFMYTALNAPYFILGSLITTAILVSFASA